jgi:hypothetical protein
LHFNFGLQSRCVAFSEIFKGVNYARGLISILYFEKVSKGKTQDLLSFDEVLTENMTIQ